MLYLLALQQRFTLMMLSDAVAERWLPALHKQQLQRGRKAQRSREATRDAFNEILDTFLGFTARGYFAQVIQGERHHNYYRKWQEVFQVQQFYEEVRDEVTQMRDHLEMIETRRLNETLQFLTAVSIILAIFGAMSAWWATNFEPMADRSWPGSWPLDFILLNAVMAVVILLTAGFFLRKRWILRGLGRRKQPERRQR